MNVHLANDVANIADVDFIWGEVFFNTLANDECGGIDVLVF